MIFRRVLGCQGMTFGIMDGVITVLGVMAGLFVLGDKAIIIAGMLVAGLADSLANAAGIHVSQETEGAHKRKEILMATFLAFLSTAAVTVVLTLPVILMPVQSAFFASIGIGILMIAWVGYYVSQGLEKDKKGSAKLIFEYIAIAIGVIVLSSLIGVAVKALLGVV